MPAKSVAQRRYMGMCEHNPQHAYGKCPDMTKQQFHDFAATPEKGLPSRAAATAIAKKYKMKKK